MDIKEVNVKVLTMTLQFNNPIFKEKYDEIVNMSDNKIFKNTKVLIYDKYKFNILCKNQKDFFSAYKQVINDMINL